jgi:hypothetical protein
VHRPGARSASLSALLAAVACGGASEGPLAPLCATPVVSRAEAVVDSTNALRAFARGAVQGADSVVVRFGLGATRDGATPAVVPVGDSIVTPILGLEAARRYEAQLVAHNRCGTTLSGALIFDTPPLPADLFERASALTMVAGGTIVIAADPDSPARTASLTTRPSVLSTFVVRKSVMSRGSRALC